MLAYLLVSDNLEVAYLEVSFTFNFFLLMFKKILI